MLSCTSERKRGADEGRGELIENQGPEMDGDVDFPTEAARVKEVVSRFPGCDDMIKTAAPPYQKRSSTELPFGGSSVDSGFGRANQCAANGQNGTAIV